MCRLCAISCIPCNQNRFSIFTVIAFQHDTCFFLFLLLLHQQEGWFTLLFVFHTSEYWQPTIIVNTFHSFVHMWKYVCLLRLWIKVYVCVCVLNVVQNIARRKFRIPNLSFFFFLPVFFFFLHASVCMLKQTNFRFSIVLRCNIPTVTFGLIYVLRMQMWNFSGSNGRNQNKGKNICVPKEHTLTKSIEKRCVKATIVCGDGGGGGSNSTSSSIMVFSIMFCQPIFI